MKTHRKTPHPPSIPEPLKFTNKKTTKVELYRGEKRKERKIMRFKKENCSLVTLSFISLFFWSLFERPPRFHHTETQRNTFLSLFALDTFTFALSFWVMRACATRLVPLSQEKDEDYHRHHSKTHAHIYADRPRRLSNLLLPVFVLIQSFLPQSYIDITFVND